jgi:N6-L-threonylcarbamoyladenine synthase/protein kinase Bud32
LAWEKSLYLVEDKGVDLLVFKKAISGIHHEISQVCFDSIFKDMNVPENCKEVVARLMKLKVGSCFYLLKIIKK